ncbi:MAG: hypothetical protein ACXIUV_00345 [Alkalilacustris sp.]
MRTYGALERDFIRMIVAKTSATDSFFQRVVSEHFFSSKFRPFLLILGRKKKVVAFFTPGKKHDEFFKLFTLVGLLEELEKDGLILRMNVRLDDDFFIGEEFAISEFVSGEGIIRSSKTGRHLKLNDYGAIYNSRGCVAEKLDPVVFDDSEQSVRLARAFSGLVYPRESLIKLSKDNFKTVDQRRHRQAMLAAWAAIGLSFGLSLDLQEPVKKHACERWSILCAEERKTEH